MPTLHLQVCAGFANRVRAMISGICLAEHLQLPLVIHWFPKSPECVCKFSSVLDPESLPKTVKIVPEDIYMASEVLSQEDWERKNYYWDKTSDVSIKSYGIFFWNERYDFHLRNLKPSPPVKDLLMRRCAAVDWSRAIGVHIRRGDNKKSIEGSPLESFLMTIRSFPHAFFVIATDDTKVKETLELEFLGRCLFPATTLSRRTEEGMVHGVADFFALTKCTRILGSTASSFSEMAARYSGSEFTLIQLEKPQV
jgi:hypothetical protein